MSRKKHKGVHHSTSHENRDSEDAASHSDKLDACTFMSVPIDILKEIASYLYPKDVLMITRVNKALRKVLMQRSAIHMWRSAERNVEMLPPCPIRLCEPQYAALMFTNECSKCGVSVMRGIDEYLGVRLCNSCRKTNLVDCSEISSDVHRYVPVSTLIKKGSVYALRDDVDRIEGGLSKFSHSSSQQAYKRWKGKKKHEYNSWMKHVSSLLRYLVHAEKCREDEIEHRKQARRDEVVSRLQQHGWKLRDTYMISTQRNQAWRELVNVDRPLTDQTWKRLYPKLNRLLKRNRENWQVIGKDYRHHIRSSRLRDLLAEMRANSCPYIEVAESGFSNFVMGEQIHLLFPSYRELRAYHVFKDLLDTDRSVDAMVVKFGKCRQLMNNAIVKWRANFERQLVIKVQNGRRAEKREVFDSGIELVEDDITISTKLTDSSYQYVSAKNSVLLRADSIFKFKNSHWVAHYPTSFVHMANYLHKQSEEQLEGGLVVVEHDELLPMFEHHDVGARVARALLATLGCPDAAYIEMNAPGMAYICGRCHYPLPHTWGMIIEHYVLEYNQWKSHSLRGSGQHHGIVYNNVHCLQQSYAKPLVKLMSSKEFNESKIRLCSPTEVVECNRCVQLKLDYVFRGSRKYVALHLRDVHCILQPEYGDDYIEWRTLGRDPASDVFPIGELEM